jgi:hypothetical protein
LLKEAVRKKNKSRIYAVGRAGSDPRAINSREKKYYFLAAHRERLIKGRARKKVATADTRRKKSETLLSRAERKSKPHTRNHHCPMATLPKTTTSCVSILSVSLYYRMFVRQDHPLMVWSRCVSRYERMLGQQEREALADRAQKLNARYQPVVSAMQRSERGNRTERSTYAPDSMIVFYTPLFIEYHSAVTRILDRISDLLRDAPDIDAQGDPSQQQPANDDDDRFQRWAEKFADAEFELWRVSALFVTNRSVYTLGSQRVTTEDYYFAKLVHEQGADVDAAEELEDDEDSGEEQEDDSYEFDDDDFYNPKP